MPTNSPDPTPAVGKVDRVLGRVRGLRPGPTLLAVAGIHGNEPAGVLALRRVLEAAEGRKARVAGDFIALAGNRSALASGSRFLARDLNRGWSPRTGDAVRVNRPAGTGDPEETPEDREQVELLAALEEALEGARGPVFFLDLHTTSGPGVPFCTIVDSPASRRLALTIPVPLILGLGELLQGTLLGYLAAREIPGVVFEGGQHAALDSIEASEAGIWRALAGAGLIRDSEFPEVVGAARRLVAATGSLPAILKIRHRHPLSPGDEFRMLPGFRSFQHVRGGDLLAHDERGPVPAPETGRLLMPLYQVQGEDGFFLVQAVASPGFTVAERFHHERRHPPGGDRRDV